MGGSYNKEAAVKITEKIGEVAAGWMNKGKTTPPGSWWILLMSVGIRARGLRRGEAGRQDSLAGKESVNDGQEFLTGRLGELRQGEFQDADGQDGKGSGGAMTRGPSGDFHKGPHLLAGKGMAQSQAKQITE